MQSKHTTVDDLAKSIDSLAVMTKHGFDAIDKKFETTGKDIKDLKEGQERIELKLDNVAYRFELVALQKRVEILEKKLKTA